MRSTFFKLPTKNYKPRVFRTPSVEVKKVPLIHNVRRSLAIPIIGSVLLSSAALMQPESSLKDNKNVKDVKDETKKEKTDIVKDVIKDDIKENLKKINDKDYITFLTKQEKLHTYRYNYYNASDDVFRLFALEKHVFDDIIIKKHINKEINDVTFYTLVGRFDISDTNIDKITRRYGSTLSIFGHKIVFFDFEVPNVRIFDYTSEELNIYISFIRGYKYSAKGDKIYKFNNDFLSLMKDIKTFKIISPEQWLEYHKELFDKYDEKYAIEFIKDPNILKKYLVRNSGYVKLMENK